jgi:arylsulfatase A-like enzyme
MRERKETTPRPVVPGEQPVPRLVAAAIFALAGWLGACLLTLSLTSRVELVAALALAGVLGAALGLALFVLHSSLSWVGARASKPLYTALFAFASLQGCAMPLGVWTKLRGPHATLAALALVGSLVAGGLLGALVRWGYHGALHGRLERRERLKRLALTALLVAAALSLAVYETTQGWLRGYPAARHALFGTAWLCATTAGLSLVPLLSAGAQRVAAWLMVGVVSLGLLRVISAGAAAWATLVRVPYAEHWVALGRFVTDFDRDGFSSLLSGGDCAPFDARVSPGAREVPGNGVDDNCRFGDARLLPAPATVDLGALGTAKSSVVLVTVDALRADRTTPYGAEHDTTPNLSVLSAQAVRYSNAYTSGGWTCLALSSLFSGVYPRRLHWRPVVLTSPTQRLLDFPWESALAADESVATVLTLPAEDPEWWLPLALQQRGYRTVAVTSAKVSPMFRRAFGRGWDRFVTDDEIEDEKTVDRALSELSQLRSPFFLWVHLFDPHEPQTEHRGAPSFGSSMLDKYDHEVASTDRQLGRLLRALEGSPNVALIVSADHGESFDHGSQLHGLDLLEDSIKIPLIVRAPGWKSGVNTSPASLVDLGPTILALTGTPIPRGLDGRDLERLSGNDSVLTDLLRIDQQGQVWLDQVAATNRSLRLVRDNLKLSDALLRVGDLARPPAELASTRVPAELLEALERHAESSIAPASTGAGGGSIRGRP